MAAPFYSPVSNIQGSDFSMSSPGRGHPQGVQWHRLTVLIRVNPKLDVEQLFMCLLAICMSSQRNVYSCISPSFFLKIRWFVLVFTCIQVLYMFWIGVLCHMYLCRYFLSVWPFRCCCSVTQSCPTLHDSMGCSTPDSPVLHYLPEFAQIHVHWVGDAIQTSHPLLLSSSLVNVVF